MSFLARISPVYTTTRISPALIVSATRSISSTAHLEKGPMDTTKDTLRKADRTVSDAAVKGIEKGENARDKLRNAASIRNKEAKEKTEHMKGEAAEVAGQGRGKTEEAIGGAKSHVKGLSGKTG